jgi:hypothetical protein
MDVRLRIRVMRPQRVIVTVAAQVDPHQLAVFMASDALCVRRVAEMPHTRGISHFDQSVFGEYGDERIPRIGHRDSLTGKVRTI